MKKKNSVLSDYSILLVGLAICALFWYGGTQGWFKSISTSTTSISNTEQSLTPYPDKIVDEFKGYDVVLSLTPSTICVGEVTTGKIVSNINNGACSIFVNINYGSWQLFRNIALNSYGYYSESATISTAGTANFAAVCCDADRNCKLSNAAMLSVSSCDHDGDGIPDDQDPDDDNDGFPDEVEIDAGTDPLDPDDYPGSDEDGGSDCNSVCISKGYVSGRGPFDSGQSCVGGEQVEYFSGNMGPICCCLN